MLPPFLPSVCIHNNSPVFHCIIVNENGRCKPGRPGNEATKTEEVRRYMRVGSSVRRHERMAGCRSRGRKMKVRKYNSTSDSETKNTCEGDTV